MSSEEPSVAAVVPTAIRSKWLFFAGLCLASSAWAAEAADTVIFPGGAARAEATTRSASGGFGSTALLGVLVLGGAGAWLLWRGKKSNLGGRDVRQLQIAETRPLGNRQYLVVASYREKKFLLGVCPGRIELLAPLHEPSGGEKSPS